MNLKLIGPTKALESSYLEYLEELGDEERYPYPMDLDHSDFSGLIQTLHNYSRGIDLPDWLVPNTTYWFINQKELVGVAHLRHELNSQLREAGGHIGLGIRPSYRGKGFGKEILRQTIEKARELGIKDVHIHCHRHNEASARMIRSVGGILESEITEEGTDKIVQRYIASDT
ncbi:MAG: GNAT family N-acetyltransferase [Pseudomonadota bacterium]